TINGSLDHWVARVPFKKPELLLPGTHGGGYFKVELELQNLPSEQDRHFISARVTTSSYRPDDSLRIYDANKSEILWTLNSPNKFADNKSVLSIKGSHSEHQIYINSYRGAPGSASVRLTGIGGTGGEALLFLAEAQLAYWFNDIFRWDNYWLGRQRWGTSARFFTSTSRIQRLGGNLSVAQFDLRYRFQPGLCERDPATGAILAVESVTLPGFKTEKIGIGFFWSRSMPKVFDRWISLLPYMNYPKWVDMEFVRYVSSTKSDIELGEDYLLNFQGKVLWRKNFFGEAGFGAKFYSARNRAEDSRMQLSTFHGTAGLGFNF
ncbi:MAG: hypothetical protein N2578_00925, partial [Bdellovibrionaceae bacterium]|nr:hypothetical protein [Pseudobdellovibrionaceae bacterium]